MEKIMQDYITSIIEKIAQKDVLHGKKLRKTLKKAGQDYLDKANVFFDKYVKYVESQGKNLDFGIDCYLRMIADLNYESVKFQETGQYSSSSFAEVNERVYNNPDVMEYYMHALLLSQFLWVQHNRVFNFFNDYIDAHRDKITSYLEIGAGHGLYLEEAINRIGDGARYDVVDISETSIQLSESFVENKTPNFILCDIFEYEPGIKYDHITMGEVLEHVEDPVGLLKRLGELVADDGRIYITTPTNSPTIDHIYLFRNIQDIQDVIHEAGLEIVDELYFYSEDLPDEIAEKMKVTQLYLGILKKRTA